MHKLNTIGSKNIAGFLIFNVRTLILKLIKSGSFQGISAKPPLISDQLLLNGYI
jgi:hypothetical protein